MHRFGSVAELKEVIEICENRYRRGLVGSTQVTVNNETVDVIYERHRYSYDCGLPAMWEFTGDFAALTRWWLLVHEGEGVAVLPPEEKEHLGFQANLQYRAPERGVPFNFHITVPRPRGS